MNPESIDPDKLCPLGYCRKCDAYHRALVTDRPRPGQATLEEVVG